MRSGTTKRLLLGAVIFLSAAGIAAARLRPGHTRTADGRLIAPPADVQQAFKRFADSAGKRLIDTLFVLGYHGGYSWDEKAGAVRPDLVVRTDSGSVADSTNGIYEATLSLDFHHDERQDVPPSLSLRFASVGDSSKWTLLTTDGFPEDPSTEMPLEGIRKLPHELNDAVVASFADHADAFEFWKGQESRHPAP